MSSVYTKINSSQCKSGISFLRRVVDGFIVQRYATEINQRLSRLSGNVIAHIPLYLIRKVSPETENGRKLTEFALVSKVAFANFRTSSPHFLSASRLASILVLFSFFMFHHLYNP